MGQIEPHLKSTSLFLAAKTPSNAKTIIHFVDEISNAQNLLDLKHIRFDTLNGAEDTPTNPTTARFIHEQARETYCHAIIS